MHAIIISILATLNVKQVLIFTIKERCDYLNSKNTRLTDRKGVSIVQLKITDELEWIFREQPIWDDGIDAFIEPMDENEIGTGKLFALQIKSGKSWFQEEQDEKIVFRVDLKHYKRWTEYSEPVLIVLCDIESKECYYEWFCSENVILTGKGCKLLINRENCLNHNAKSDLLKIYESFNKKYTKQLEKKTLECQSKNELTIRETIIRDGYGYITSYAYGLGKVRIDAFLPTTLKNELCCCILFSKKDIEGCMIAFDEEEIIDTLFVGNEKKVSLERKFIYYIEGNEVGISVKGMRFLVDYETAEQLCVELVRLEMAYMKEKNKILDMVGAKGFEEIAKGEFLLLQMPKSIWINMVDFAQEHDHYTGSGEWDMFHPLALFRKERIIIYKNHLQLHKGDILAELYVPNIDENQVNVVWKAGYTPNIGEMSGFDNSVKWKVNYTHDWLMEKFIPYILRYCGYIKIPFFVSRKKELNLREYGIRSCKK